MARKPHNYSHFQNLVNELKDQNKNNIATIEKQMEVQSALLYSMRGLLLKGVNADKVKDRKDRENELEEKKEGRKELNMKSKMNLPRFSGKGFMGMLGNFLSTALMGIPGGLRRFMPASLGMALLPKLARGIALLVAGPALVQALQAGFDQDTFSGGVRAFIDSFFSPSGGAYKSLAEAAAGGAGKGALIGFGLLGPRGAIIGGVLGGALTGLNHIFAEDKSKVDSKNVMNKVKEHLYKNFIPYMGLGGAALFGKMGMLFGPAGMVAGAILGAGIGIIGAGTIKEMMEIERATGADWKSAMTAGLVKWFSSDQMKGVLEFAPGGGALFGALVLSKFGPAGMMAGLILGAGAGLLAGPVLAEALRIDKAEGKGMANAYKKALVEYFKASPYARKMVAGGALGGIAGAFLTAGSIPGILGGMILGAALGYALQVVTDELDALFGISKKKAVVAAKLEEELATYGGAQTTQTKMHQAQQDLEVIDDALRTQGVSPTTSLGLSTILSAIKNAGGLWDIWFPGKNAPPIPDHQIGPGALKNSLVMQKLLEAGNVDVDQLHKLRELKAQQILAQWEETRRRSVNRGGGGDNVVLQETTHNTVRSDIQQNVDFNYMGDGLFDGAR